MRTKVQKIFFDVSQVKESISSQSDFTHPHQIFDANLLVNKNFTLKVLFKHF